MKGATTQSRSKKSTNSTSKRGPGRPRGSTNKKTSGSSSSSTTRRSSANSRSGGSRARFGTFVNATDGMPTKKDPMGRAVVADDEHLNTGSCSLVYGDCVGDDAQVEGELRALRNETNSSRRKDFEQKHNKTHQNTTSTSSSSSSSQQHSLSGLHHKDATGHYTSPRMDHSKKFHTFSRSPAMALLSTRITAPFSGQQKFFSNVNFIIQDDVSARGMTGSASSSSSTASSTASRQQQQKQQHQQEDQKTPHQQHTMSSGNQHRDQNQQQEQQYQKMGAGTSGTTRGSGEHAEKPTQRHDTRQNPFFNSKTSATSSHMKQAQQSAAVGANNAQHRTFSTRVTIKRFMKKHFSTQPRGPYQEQHNQQHRQQQKEQEKQQQQQQQGRHEENKTTTTTASTASSPSSNRNEKLNKKVDSTLNNNNNQRDNRKSIEVSEEKF